MTQRSVSRIHEGDLPLQDANGAAWIRKSFISTVLSYRFGTYVSAKTRRDKKLISKRQVARLFGVSMRTIDCWLHDGKLPEPKRSFPRQKWDYKELVVRTRLKVSVHRQALIFTISFVLAFKNCETFEEGHTITEHSRFEWANPPERVKRSQR